MVAESASTALAVYNRIADPVSAVKTFGESIARSQMFGCQSTHQGEIFAWECLARQMPPLMLAETYHVIFGRLSMKAEKMLSRFAEAGGKYVITSRTADLVAIEMEIGGRKQAFSLSWEDAQKEPFVYKGEESEILKALASDKKPSLKPKYQTPRSRMQMLWARLVSDAVRCMYPQALSGSYTPEEIEDARDLNPEQFAGSAGNGNGNGNGNGHAKAKSASVVEQAEKSLATEPAGGEAGEIVDAEYEVKKPVEAANSEPPFDANVTTSATTTAATAATNAATPATADDLATPYQVRRIGELEVILACGPAIEKALQKRGVNSVRSLKKADAMEILNRLEANYTAHIQAADAQAGEITGKSKADEKSQSIAISGPATEEQVKRLKSELAAWAQVDKPGYDAGMAKLKQKLADSGKSKFADLSAADAAKLYEAVQMKSFDAFVRLSLESWQPKEQTQAAEQGATPGN